MRLSLEYDFIGSHESYRKYLNFARFLRFFSFTYIGITSITHSWQRVPTTYFMKTALFCLIPLLKFCPRTPPMLSPLCPFCCLDRTTSDVLLYLMISWIYIVSKGPCCVFYATRCQVYWGLTHNRVFLIALRCRGRILLGEEKFFIRWWKTTFCKY